MENGLKRGGSAGAGAVIYHFTDLITEALMLGGGRGEFIEFSSCTANEINKIQDYLPKTQDTELKYKCTTG